ncbi:MULTISPECIES: RNA polymerase sigma-70 factor [unclassified Sphingobacterium]|uniref:RNA polymerase sigma-70 factor n=1 Tax=unclassified Sphingobacterium TaxID=2609468 RepID=UPI001AE46BE7|nr:MULTISPECIES: RNA polymerase sigma-70 factor [unclassified Sphingobacterium]MDR6733526.1 RNA polymerase sigma-70 factor (ECF subfamily) [Sphingobacterium sp. 2149]
MNVTHVRQLFTQLYEENWGKLYVHVFRMLDDQDEARDIVQEIFTNLWDRMERLEIVHSYHAYLYRSARNLVINRIANQDVGRKYDNYLQHAVPTFEVMPDELLREKELAEQIDKAIERLPRKMALIFRKSRFEQRSYREIAAELDISEQTVKKQIYNALTVLRKKIRTIFIFFYH